MIAPKGQDRKPSGELTDSDSKKKLDEDGLIERLRGMFTDAVDGRAEWQEAARDSQKFVGGDQWSQADKQKIAKEKRPVITINRVLSTVLFLEGLQRTQRTEPTLLPFEADDVRPTELMNALYKWVTIQCRGPVVDDKVFRNKLITGIGWWKAVLNYYDDVNPTPAWDAPNPLSIFVDPNFWGECSMDSVEFIGHGVWVTQREAIDRFPKKAAEIKNEFGEWLNGNGRTALGTGEGDAELAGDPLSEERTWWDKETKRMRLLELWYLNRVRTKIAVIDPDTDGEQVVDDIDEVKRIEAALEARPELAERVLIQESVVKRCRVAYLLDHVLCDDGPSPWDEQCLPFFPTVAYCYDRYPFGPVEVQKDPQRVLNRYRSSVMDLVARMPQSGWMYPRDSMRNEDLEKWARGNGVGLPFDGQTKPEMIQPPQIPPAVAYMDSRAVEDLMAVVNVNPELLGTTSQKTVSGRAISARQRSAVVVQEPLLESFRQDMEPAVKFMIGAIQQWIPVRRAIRILGSIAMQGTQIGMEQMAQAAARVGEIQQQSSEFELYELMQNAMLTRFDVVIDTNKPFDPSVHQRTLETFADLVQQFGPQSVPPQVLVDVFKEAGLLTEKHAQQILAWQQQQMEAAQAPPQLPAPPPEMAQ